MTAVGVYEAAQAAVLGSLLLGASPERVTVEHGLGREHFTGWHADAFAAAMACTEAGDPIDAMTVANRMGGRDADRALIDAVATVPSLHNLDAHCRIVREHAAWRHRAQQVTEIAAAIEARDEDAFAAHAAALREDHAGARHDDRTTTPEQAAQAFLDWLDDDDAGRAWPTPFPALTKALLGGLRPGHTTCLFARSHTGKSWCVDQLLAHAADHGGATAHLFMNEMTREDRVARVMARRAGVSLDALVERKLDGGIAQKLIGAANRGLPFGFTMCAGWSADDIARHVRKHKPAVWAVDLVTRIPAMKTPEWDHISGRLVDAAVQTSTHGILVGQLNRSNLTGPEMKPPTRADMRNTGAWYDDHHNVVYLHRQQHEIPHDDGTGSGIYEIADEGVVILDKARTGRPGTVVPVVWVGGRLEFREQIALRSVA